MMSSVKGHMRLRNVGEGASEAEVSVRSSGASKTKSHGSFFSRLRGGNSSKGSVTSGFDDTASLETIETNNTDPVVVHPKNMGHQQQRVVDNFDRLRMLRENLKNRSYKSVAELESMIKECDEIRDELDKNEAEQEQSVRDISAAEETRLEAAATPPRTMYQRRNSVVDVRTVPGNPHLERLKALTDEAKKEEERIKQERVAALPPSTYPLARSTTGGRGLPPSLQDDLGAAVPMNRVKSLGKHASGLTLTKEDRSQNTAKEISIMEVISGTTEAANAINSKDDEDSIKIVVDTIKNTVSVAHPVAKAPEQEPSITKEPTVAAPAATKSTDAQTNSNAVSEEKRFETIKPVVEPATAVSGASVQEVVTEAEKLIVEVPFHNEGIEQTLSALSRDSDVSSLASGSLASSSIKKRTPLMKRLKKMVNDATDDAADDADSTSASKRTSLMNSFKSAFGRRKSFPASTKSLDSFSPPEPVAIEQVPSRPAANVVPSKETMEAASVPAPPVPTPSAPTPQKQAPQQELQVSLPGSGTPGAPPVADTIAALTQALNSASGDNSNIQIIIVQGNGANGTNTAIPLRQQPSPVDAPALLPVITAQEPAPVVAAKDYVPDDDESSVSSPSRAVRFSPKRAGIVSRGVASSSNPRQSDGRPPRCILKKRASFSTEATKAVNKKTQAEREDDSVATPTEEQKDSHTTEESSVHSTAIDSKLETAQVPNVESGEEASTASSSVANINDNKLSANRRAVKHLRRWRHDDIAPAYEPNRVLACRTEAERLRGEDPVNLIVDPVENIILKFDPTQVIQSGGKTFDAITKLDEDEFQKKTEGAMHAAIDAAGSAVFAVDAAGSGIQNKDKLYVSEEDEEEESVLYKWFDVIINLPAVKAAEDFVCGELAKDEDDRFESEVDDESHGSEKN